MDAHSTLLPGGFPEQAPFRVMRRTGIAERPSTVIALLVLTLLLRLAGGESAFVAYALVAGFALLGFGQAVQSLAISALLTMMNTGVEAEAGNAASVGRYVVIGSAAMSVSLRSLIGHRTLSVSRPVAATVLLGTLIVVHSMLFSAVPEVSVLKAVSWTLSVVTLFGAWNGLPDEIRPDLKKRIFVGLLLVAAASAPLIATKVGYLRNGTGFQGVLNHPQPFGVAMALLASYLATTLLAKSRPRWIDLASLGGVLVLIVLSEARTAGLALVIGIVVAVILVVALTGRRIVAVLPGLRSRRFGLIVVGGAAALAVFGASLTDTLLSYVQKRGEHGSVAKAYEQSRGALIDRMVVNIARYPWHGIGFGIASEPTTMSVARDPVLGLPVGAAVEKGIMPLAVLEGLGLPCTALVVLWIAFVLKRAVKSGVVAAAVVCTALATNLGEFTFFSPGGMGMLVMVLVTGASVSSRREID